MEKESIFIFGVSEFSRLFFELVGNNYNVEGFIDNSAEKQGSVFCGKKIFNADILRNINTKVIIVSTHYKDIIKQLEYIGFYNYEYIDSFDYFIYHYPNEIKTYVSEIAKKLRTSIKSDKVNVLIISIGKQSIYSPSLAKALDTYSTNINAISCLPSIYMPDYKPIIVEFFKEIGYFDVIDFHYLGYGSIDYIECLRSNCNRLVITIYGSDVYVDKFDEGKKRALELADTIIFSNPKTVDFFAQKYGSQYNKKIKICDFGLEAFDSIDNLENDSKYIRKQFGIRSDKIVVMCGSNATKQMNHLAIIDQISNLSPNIKDKLFLIIPVMYPKIPESKLYIEEIKNRIATSGVDYYVTNDELVNAQEIARYRVITDIFIILRDTDQLSGTMLESLYAGSAVLAGSWLPYDDLIKQGLPIFTVDSMDKMTEGFLMLLELMRDKELISEYATKSKEVLEHEYKWKFCYKRWEYVYLSHIQHFDKK